jgi:hypothetical protein
MSHSALAALELEPMSRPGKKKKEEKQQTIDYNGT